MAYPASCRAEGEDHFPGLTVREAGLVGALSDVLNAIDREKEIRLDSGQKDLTHRRAESVMV